jgi:hypothetical protein
MTVSHNPVWSQTIKQIESLPKNPFFGINSTQTWSVELFTEAVAVPFCGCPQIETVCVSPGFGSAIEPQTVTVESFSVTIGGKTTTGGCGICGGKIGGITEIGTKIVSQRPVWSQTIVQIVAFPTKFGVGVNVKQRLFPEIETVAEPFVAPQSVAAKIGFGFGSRTTVQNETLESRGVETAIGMIIGGSGLTDGGKFGTTTTGKIAVSQLPVWSQTMTQIDAFPEYPVVGVNVIQILLPEIVDVEIPFVVPQVVAVKISPALMSKIGTQTVFG